MRLIFRFLTILIVIFWSGYINAGEIKIIDSKHYSNVFGEMRNYRIFLPSGYDENSYKRYPVIYFFHGWSQRYFGITRGNGFDKGNDNEGDNIANFVSEHDVIVVKWDGFNIREGDEYYLRPYNISPVETYRQFPIYFPEFVRYIDSNYRTIPDRNHRAVSGLSMGGFMTFWVGGKYPHLVSAAGNFCGSPEFFNGPKAFPVEYRHTDMYKNYGGMNVRLNYGNKDFIRAYHVDMNKIWTQVMDNYEYKIYEAAHSTCGLGEMFEFIMKTFENPPPEPKSWHHIDVYPEFSVWGYNVSSNREVPGFTKLENVNKRGFRCSVREFLPDGELMPYVKLNVTTTPIYDKNSEYIINDINPAKNQTAQYIIKSDNNGRLKIPLNGYLSEIGINKKDDTPNITLALFEIDNMNWAAPLKNVKISVQLLNKGGTKADGVIAELTATRNNAKIIKSKVEFGSINVNEIKKSITPFIFYVNADSIEIEKFKLVIRDNKNKEWTNFFEVPIMIDYPEIINTEIADGKEFTVARAGTSKTSIVLGSGNGDGIANPGESIVILVKDNNTYNRTFLYTSDKYVNPNGINLRASDNWSSYDHVGGSAKYSVPLISSDCPENHIIEFFTEYWLPSYPDHIIKRGKAKIRVSGEDNTPPQIQWVKVTGDNTIKVKVIDGGKIEKVKANLKSKSGAGKYPEFVLNNDGIDGDKIKDDNVFSTKIPEQKFSLYNVEIEAADIFGNDIVKNFSDVFVIY